MTRSNNWIISCEKYLHETTFHDANHAPICFMKSTYLHGKETHYRSENNCRLPTHCMAIQPHTGTFIWAKGDVYEGGWRSGQMNGECSKNPTPPWPLAVPFLPPSNRTPCSSWPRSCQGCVGGCQPHDILRRGLARLVVCRHARTGVA